MMKRYEVVLEQTGGGRPPKEYRSKCFVNTEQDVPEYYWTLVDKNGNMYHGRIYCNGLTEFNDYRNFDIKGIPASVRKDIKEVCRINERITFFYNYDME